MLSYAEDMPELREDLVDIDDDLITYDFLVELFLREVKLILQRGIVKHYVAHEKETSHLSGRIMFHESMTSLMWRRPTIVCEKDEYTDDILFNQIMKATLETIYRLEVIKQPLRQESYFLAEQLFYVESISLLKRTFSNIRFHRHNVHYKRMIHLAYLLFHLQLLSHRHGDWTLLTARVTDRELSHIFEKFLRNFYKQEQSHYHVKSHRFSWHLEGNQSLLPRMETDLFLRHRTKDKAIIMDAKFYKDVFQWHFDKPSFRSAHLYQLFAYTEHQPHDHDVRGILIYPYNGRRVKEVYRYSKYRLFEIRTIDLSMKWNEIREFMLSLLDGE